MIDDGPLVLVITYAADVCMHVQYTQDPTSSGVLPHIGSSGVEFFCFFLVSLLMTCIWSQKRHSVPCVTTLLTFQCLQIRIDMRPHVQ